MVHLHGLSPGCAAPERMATRKASGYHKSGTAGKPPDTVPDTGPDTGPDDAGKARWAISPGRSSPILADRHAECNMALLSDAVFDELLCLTRRNLGSDGVAARVPGMTGPDQSGNSTHAGLLLYPVIIP